MAVPARLPARLPARVPAVPARAPRTDSTRAAGARALADSTRAAGARTTTEPGRRPLRVAPPPPVTTPRAPFVLLVLALVAGVVAAIGPARRASRLDVLEALAYE